MARERDGTIDYMENATVNADGNTERVDIDRDNDGTVDSVYANLSWNTDGEVLQRQRQTANGEVINTDSFTYDADNNLRLVTRRDRADEIIYRMTNTFNDAGDLATQVTDSDADGTDDSTLTVAYDADSNFLSGEFEAAANNNETPENITTGLTWDVDNNTLTSETDYGNDGAMDQSTTNTWDANGNILTRLTVGAGDDNPDYMSVNVEDADGNVLSSTYDYYADSTEDELENLEYDANGNATLYTLDKNGDGVLDEKWTQEFDSNGFFSVYRSDSDGDGQWDFILEAVTECMQ